jgi:hypothetical protein
MDLPVLPDVGSIMVHPGFRYPSFSASSTMRRAIRSLILPPELKNSHLATDKNADLLHQATFKYSHLIFSNLPANLLQKIVLQMERLEKYFFQFCPDQCAFTFCQVGDEKKLQIFFCYQIA